MKVLRKSCLLGITAFILLFELGCGDQYRPVANPITSPGGQPQAAHFAWSVNYNPNGNGSTTELDVSGNTNLAVNYLGVGSIAEAFPPNSLALFVANSGDDTVSEYLPTLGTAVTTISLLPGSHPVFLGSAQSGTMFSVNSGPNSTCPNSGSISTILVSTLNVSTTVCVGLNPIALAQSSANGYIYILNHGDNTISVYNASSQTITGTIVQTSNGGVDGGVDLNPVSVTASTDGNFIFVVTQGDGVNPGALDIISSGAVTVGARTPLGVKPTFSVIDPNLNRLYVANTGDNTVSVFDASSVVFGANPPIPSLANPPVKVGTAPVGITALPDGSKFYVANSGSDDVTVVSANSFSPLTTIALPGGANPVWVSSEPTSSKVYVAEPGASEITIIQTSNNSIAQSVPAPPQNPSCTSSCALQQPVMVLAR